MLRSVARIIDVMGRIPACVTNGRLDVLYANDLAQALFSFTVRHPTFMVMAARA